MFKTICSWLITFILLLPMTSLGSVIDLSKDQPTWLLNSESNSYQTLAALGITDEQLTQWLIPDIQIVLMGNVFDLDSDINEQLNQLTRLQALAESSNSRLILLQGANEYTLLASATSENTLPMIVRWHNHLITQRGLSLTAQLDDFDSTKETINWSKEIHLPMHYQGNQICHPYFETSRLRKVLEQYNSEMLWVSRVDASPNKDWQQRLGDQLNMIGRNVIVKLLPDNTVSVLKDGKEVEPQLAPKRYPSNPLAMTDDEIIEILQKGEIVNSEEIPVGVTNPVRLTLQFKGKVIDAIFKTVDTAPRQERRPRKPKHFMADRYGNEIVTYKLDRLLGLGLVPAVVERTIADTKGSLQVWYDDLISKRSYRKKDMKYAGHCDLKAQREMMHVFDYLIRNEDRNQSNMLYNASDWQIWFIDHSRAFDSKRDRHEFQEDSKFTLTDEFRAALIAIERAQLNQFRPWIHKVQIRSIYHRKQDLINGRY